MLDFLCREPSLEPPYFYEKEGVEPDEFIECYECGNEKAEFSSQLDCYVCNECGKNIPFDRCSNDSYEEEEEQQFYNYR